MNASIRHLFSDKITTWGFGISWFLLGMNSIYIAIFYTKLPPFLPIYNRMPWGYGRLGTRIEIVLPLVLTIFFTVINFFLASSLYAKITLMSRLIAMINFILCICLSIYIIKIVNIVL